MTFRLRFVLAITLVACGPDAGGDASAGSGNSSTGTAPTSVASGSGVVDSTSATTISSTGTGSATSGNTSTTSTTTADSSGDTRPVCDCTDEQVCTPDGCRGGQIFVNFDGPLLTVARADDATADQTQVMQLGGQMLPYGGDQADRDALLDGVRAHFTGLSVWITDQRPVEGTYSMIVLGDNLGPFPGAAEISVLDCGNANPSSVSFAGIHVNDGFSLDDRVTIVAHAAGHAEGLEHVISSDAIMAGALNVRPSFVGNCTPLMDGGTCSEHTRWCAAGQQNSWEELVDRFGVR